MVRSAVADGRAREGSHPPWSSEGLISEIPGSQLTWFQADEKVVGARLGVRGPSVAAQVTRRDPQHRVMRSRGEQLCFTTELDPAVWRRMLAHHDAGPRIPA